MEIDDLKEPENEFIEDPDELKPIISDKESLYKIYKEISEGYNSGNFDQFFTKFNLLVSISESYVFGPSEEFIAFNMHKIILNILSDNNLDHFIREQSLNIIVNLTASQNNNFTKIFVDNGYLEAINEILEGDAEELYKNALSAFINISFSSDEVKEMIRENVGFQTIFNFLKQSKPDSEEFSLAARLFYTLAKTIKTEDYEIIFELFSFLLHSDNKEALSWAFWTAALICDTPDIAVMLRNIPDIADIITKYLNSDELREPIVNLIHQIHTFTDGPIEGFMYENLIDFLKDPELNLSDTVASTFANIFTHPEATQHFIDNGYMIFLVDSYHKTPFSTQTSLISCFYNAITTVPSSSVSQLIDDGVIEVLAQALHLNSNESQFQVLSCLLTLLPIPIAKQQFLENLEEDSFDDIEDSDDPKVQEIYDTFQETYPEFFIKE